jgi:hypothetical protein
MHPLTYDFAYHVDSTTLADGDYELIPDQEVEVSEDPGNAIEDLTEAPNQSSENFDTTAPTPLKKASPGHNPYFIYTATYIIYTYLCITFIGIV